MSKAKAIRGKVKVDNMKKLLGKASSGASKLMVLPCSGGECENVNKCVSFLLSPGKVFSICFPSSTIHDVNEKELWRKFTER